jgi:aryl sulfotransferase
VDEIESRDDTTGAVDISLLTPYRSVIGDNWRWAAFEHRRDDIFICTPPKCGTTWMQTIVTSLIFEGADLPAPVVALSPWLEMRAFPIDEILDGLSRQQHRRCIKSHTPADGIPWFDESRYIVVGRDGRDVFMSFLNHMRAMRKDRLMEATQSAIAEGIDVGPPPPIDDLHEFYDYWLTDGSFFHFIDTYWQRRKQDNVLFVHFNDLKADLEGQMRRVAAFLGVDIDESLWAHLTERCTFASMKARADEIGPFEIMFEGGAESFLYKGTNDRWRDVLTADELTAFEARAQELLEPEARAWLSGEQVAGVSD